MKALPPPRFPAGSRGAIRRFWIGYWLWFFALLPWMVCRQIFLCARNLLGALWTWNRAYAFFGGELELVHLSSLGSLFATTLFGERFVTSRYGDILVDPGPIFGRRQLRRWLARCGPIHVIVATHFHEEHIGNTELAARAKGAVVLATPLTLAAMHDPERLSLPRQLLMGQPTPTQIDAQPIGTTVGERPRLEVIDSAGHCRGHISLYDRQRKILFAGDSFLHEVFTAPNRDVSGADWIDTLERYRQLDIHTLVGSHGIVYSIDPEMAARAMVVMRSDPNQLVANKLAFTRWAERAVAEGERRGLPYSVIEACLFPWHRWWSWGNWFVDESWRLFSFGEFSRTHFVRSLAAHPVAVPHRFPRFERARAAVAARLESAADLIRIHLNALQPVYVLTILLSVALSLGAIEAAAGARSPSMRPDVAFASLVRDGRWPALLAVFAFMTLVWTTLGGAVTRLMARYLIRGEREPFGAALRFCARWPLAVPSALASLCFFLICAAPMRWALLVPVLPIWLYAGFLYGALTTERRTLREALRLAHGKLASTSALLRLQARFLVGFACSTGLVYLLAGAWALGVHALRPRLPSSWQVPLIAPVALYALGYTTANLKSLQIYLFDRVPLRGGD